jgi:hypothetical protein
MDEMSRACSIHRREEEFTQSSGGKNGKNPTAWKIYGYGQTGR